jgi:CheY-like chemotaxis protein
MPSKRILVVDDEPGILSALQLILEEEGYLTQTAGEATWSAFSVSSRI